MGEKLLVILAILLGVLALALLMPAVPEAPAEVAVSSGELEDSGHFVLERDGARWLDETFTLTLTADGNHLLVSQSTLTVAGATIPVAQQTLYDGGYHPLTYQMAADVPSGTQIISAQRGDHDFTMEVRAGSARQAVDGALDDDLFLLDNNVIAHYAVLFEALRAGEVGQTFSAAVPQALARIPSRWEDPVAVRFQSGGQTYAGTKTILHLGDTAMDLISYEGRFVGLANRAQGTVAYDVGLLPDGLSIVVEEAQTASAGTREREVAFASDGVALVGTLDLPPAQTPSTCALLFVAGSGPVDRDGNAPGLRMDAYRQLAVALAEHGIASLRYDKRGVGASGGDSRTASRSDLLGDVQAAWDALGAQPETAGLPRLALGHSEGTYLVSELASQSPDVAGLILVCGSTRSLADVTRWQVESLVRQQGASEAQVSASLEQEDEFISFVKESSGQWADYTAEQLRHSLPWLTDAAAQQLKSSALGLAWLREHYNADPVSVLAEVRCPVLIVSAGKDAQVPPGDGEAIAEVLREAGNSNVTAVLLEDLNHVLRHHPEEPSLIYQHLDEPVDPRVVAAVIDWQQQGFGE